MKKLLILLLLSTSFSTFADASGIPENAHTSGGTTWFCDKGYQRGGDVCLKKPRDAWWSGGGWVCIDKYELVDYELIGKYKSGGRCQKCQNLYLCQQAKDMKDPIKVEEKRKADAKKAAEVKRIAQELKSKLTTLADFKKLSELDTTTKKQVMIANNLIKVIENNPDPNAWASPSRLNYFLAAINNIIEPEEKRKAAAAAGYSSYAAMQRDIKKKADARDAREKRKKQQYTVVAKPWSEQHAFCLDHAYIRGSWSNYAYQKAYNKCMENADALIAKYENQVWEFIDPIQKQIFSNEEDSEKFWREWELKQ